MAGIAVDGKNNYYTWVPVNPPSFFLITFSRNQVHVFKSDGSKIKSIGSEGSDEGQFVNPADLVLDPDDNLVVADSGTNPSALSDCSDFLDFLVLILV